MKYFLFIGKYCTSFLKFLVLDSYIYITKILSLYSQFLLLFFNFVHIVLTSSPWRFHFNIISLVFVRTSEHCGLGGGSDASSGCRRSAGPSLELVLLVLWAVPSVVCCYGPSPWTRPLIQRAPNVSTACRSSPWLRVAIPFRLHGQCLMFFPTMLHLPCVINHGRYG